MRKTNLAIFNSISNISVDVLFNVLSLVTLPLFVSSFSSARYGIFILATGLADTLGSFDLGVSNGLIRFTAEYSADNDKERYASALVSNLLIAGGLGLLAGVIMFFVAPLTPHLFSFEEENRHVAIVLFRLAALYTVLFVLFRTSKCILDGYQLFYYRNINRLPNIAILAGLYLIVKNHEIKFTAFVIFMMAGRLIPGLLNLYVIFVKGLLKGINLKSQISWELIRSEFISYSSNLFLLQLIAFFTFQADKFIVGAIVSTSAVTIYTVITKPMYILRMIHNQSLTVLGPLLAKERRKDKKALNKNLIKKSNLALIFLIFPSVTLLILFLDPFILLWMPEYKEYTYWGIIASIVFICTPLYSVLTKIMVFTDDVYVVRNINFWTVLLNIIISIAGSFVFGIGGVIIGSVIQAIVQIPVYLILAKHKYGFSVSELYSRKIIFLCLYLCVVGIIVYYSSSQLDLLKGWAGFFKVLFVSGIIMYLPGIYLIGNKKLAKVQNHKQDYILKKIFPFRM